MNSRVSFDFAGKKLDAFVDEKQEVFITLPSFCQLSSCSTSAAYEWVRKYHPDAAFVELTSGIRNSKTKAYTAELCVDFLLYRLSRGDKSAMATLKASTLVDLQRSAREASGIQVSAAQHEQNRSSERERILKSYIEAKLGIILEDTERQEAMSQQLTSDEYQEYCWVSNKVNIEMYEWQLANFHHDDQEARDNQQQQVFDATYSRIKMGELAQIQAECNQYWSR